MSLTCQFDAPNKQPSQLYDSVYKTYGKDAAKRVWTFVRTDDFTSFAGDWVNKIGDYTKALDANGEPAIIDGTFVDTRSNTAMPVLALTETLSELAEERIRVIRRLSGIANRFSKSGRQESLDKIEGLTAQLSQVGEDKVALYRFIAFAHSQSIAAKNELIKLELKIKDTSRSKEDRKNDLRDLRRLADYIQSFSLIEDISNNIEGFGYDTQEFGAGIVDEEFKKKWISPILQIVADAKSKYKKLAKPLVVDFLYSYNNNANLTKQQLSAMLTTVHEDHSYMTRMGNGLAESGDQVLALVQRAIADARNTTQQDSFRFRQTQMRPFLEALENEAKSKGVAADDYEKLYGFMLERDSKGALTGNMVKPKNATKAQNDFFDLYVKEYRTAQRNLPEGHRRKLQLIPILKGPTERAFQDVNGIGTGLQAAGSIVKNKFVKQLTDTDKGMVEKTVDENQKQVQFIPLHYTQKIDNELGVPVRDVSLNLADSLGMFRHMAHNYHEMSEIITQLEATKDLIGERTLNIKEGDNWLMNKVTKSAITKQGTDTYAYQQLEDYLTMHVYGEKQKDEGSFSMFGMEIDKAKLVNNIIGATAFTQLGLNVYSAINNLTVGNYTNYMESAGGQFYSISDIASAEVDYTAAIPGLLKDYTGRFPTSKLAVVMEELDIFQEESPTGEPMKEKSMLRRAGFGAVHFLTKAGEHSIQSKLFIAMAKSHRVVDGKILSYSDWVVANNKKFDKASKIVFEKHATVWSQLEAKDGVIDTKLDKKDLTKFAERVKGVYQRLHGNYAGRDTPALNRHALGRMLGLFRKFLKPGWDRRWAKDTFDGEWVENEDGKKVFKSFDRFDQRLGSNIGGNYTITYNFVKSLIGNYNLLGSAMMQEDWSSLPEWKKQAVKRTVAEAAAVAALALMIKALSSMVGDDDDDPNWLATMGLYQMKRLNQEIMAFVNPVTAMQLLRSPAASMSMFEKTGKVLAQLLPGAYGAMNPESGVGRFTDGKNAGKLKVGVYFMKTIPIYSQVVRIFDPKTELDWMDKSN